MVSRRPLIGLVAEANIAPGVLYGLYDVLFSAGVAFSDMTVGDPGEAALDVRIVSLDGKPFHCIGDVPVEPHCALCELPQADALVVCDLYSPIYQAPYGSYREMGVWLRKAHEGGALVASVCSGALVLAEAGLLDGRIATCHWGYGELFARAYPSVRLRRENTLCLAAEADRIVTAGGGTSWQDLALYLLTRFCSARIARESAKVHLLVGHEDGQLPFAALNRRVNDTDVAIARCQEWVASNYAAPNPVQRMAAFLEMNERTFTRRFSLATGRSPLDYVHALRIEEAKQMLEVGAEPINDVASLVGYADPAAFRRLFRRLVGTTPAAYRRRMSKAGLA
jgi:transcriptional regulator GlxA family with amidase domain